MAPTVWTTVDSPIGELLLGAWQSALVAVSMQPPGSPARAPQGWRRDDGDPVLRAAARELDEYFSGTRTEFSVPLAPRGTPFQQTVWRALCEIPYGTTTTYGALARRIGHDLTASRAVGLANGRNHIAVIVPCHRVIGADGTLTGYGGGLPRKRWLLDHEAQVPGPLASLPLFAGVG
jgi:methylated-DNA-[protein]-cysteine S-methyltransferase